MDQPFILTVDNPDTMSVVGGKRMSKADKAAAKRDKTPSKAQNSVPHMRVIAEAEAVGRFTVLRVK